MIAATQCEAEIGAGGGALSGATFGAVALSMPTSQTGMPRRPGAVPSRLF